MINVTGRKKWNNSFQEIIFLFYHDCGVDVVISLVVLLFSFATKWCAWNNFLRINQSMIWVMKFFISTTSQSVTQFHRRRRVLVPSAASTVIEFYYGIQHETKGPMSSIKKCFCSRKHLAVFTIPNLNPWSLTYLSLKTGKFGFVSILSLQIFLLLLLQLLFRPVCILC